MKKMCWCVIVMVWLIGTGVRSVVAAHMSEGADAILAALFHACRDHRPGSAWADDATVVVVKRVG